MADEALAQAGLHFDELNKIRVLEPEVHQQTTELKEECKDFVESKHSCEVRITSSYQSITDREACGYKKIQRLCEMLVCKLGSVSNISPSYSIPM